LFLIVCLAVTLAAASANGADDLEQTYATRIQPLLVRSCGKCHGKTPTDNDLNLTSFGSAQAIIAKTKTLSNIAERVRGGDMPPEEVPQLDQVEREHVCNCGAGMRETCAFLAPLLFAWAASLHAQEVRSDSDDRSKLAALFESTVDNGGKVTIPPGDYDVDLIGPISLRSEMTVTAYGARFHLPQKKKGNDDRTEVVKVIEAVTR